MRLPAFRQAIPASILVVGVGLSGLLFVMSGNADRDGVHNRLELRSEWRARDIRDKFRDALQPVASLAAFVAAQDELTEAEFHRLARSAGEQGTLYRLAWLPLVAGAQRTEFEQKARRAGASGYEILQQRSGGGFEAAPPRDSYLPVLFERKNETLPSIKGFDFASEERRRATIEQARDAAMPIATPPVPALTGSNRAQSYTLFWPVYRTDVRPMSVADRRASLIGFASGTFHYDTMLGSALANLPDLDEAIALFIDPAAIEPSGSPTVMYRPETGIVAFGNGPLAGPSPGGWRVRRSFSAFGRVWSLVFDYQPSQVRAELSDARWFYLGFGLVLTLLLSAHALRELQRRLAVEAMVVDRTRALRRTSDQLKAIIEASPHAIIGLDSAQRVLFWNRAAEQIFGYRETEVLGRPYPVVPIDENETFQRRFASVAAGEILRGRESRRCRKDGTIIETRNSAAPFYDQQGALQGIVIEVEDLTERNQIERQLLQPQKMEEIGLLTGGISHDFNNLLGAVIGNLDLALEEMAPDSAQRELLEAAMEAAYRGAELTRQLLAFARRQPLTPEVIDPAQTLVGTVRLLRRTLGEGITIALHKSDSVWPVLIDVVQLESAILNLAVNARDAMKGGGRLSIATENATLDEAALAHEPEAKPGDYVVIAVSDTGTGMAPDVLARACEPFFTTKGTSGTGLGLSMVHGFVRQSGGYTKIDSTPGSGTIVRLYLPRANACASAKPDTARPPEIVPGTESILVVEDNEALRRTAVRQLQSLGYHTIAAADAAEALDILQRDGTIDLLFTDVVMPGSMDGRALAEMARRLRPTLAVLFTSGFTEAAASADPSDELSANLLSKPYRKRELAHRIRAALATRTVLRV
jgi:PAS domain S-box-containing protein